MSKIFGTDGIRGVFGEPPLRVFDVERLGFAAALVLHRKFPGERIRVVGVRDTRFSGFTLFTALSTGLRRGGIDVYDAGVLSTPSVAYLVHAHRFHSGFVISASHNPPRFNGVKFFNAHGRKWADEWECEIESLLEGRTLPKIKLGSGLLINASSLSDDYADFLTETLCDTRDFTGLRLVVDCSHGANSGLAPIVFERLGAKFHVIGASPNGRNINVGCGSQNLGALKDAVRKHGAHIGIAFDGDGDRVIFVDERGSTIDGDFVLALLALALKKKKELKRNTVVVTVMANVGLLEALKRNGIKYLETPVGDRHVSEAMRLHGAILGGEQSGHIILGRYLPSGDGLLTALHVLALMKESGLPLSRLASVMKKYPQVLINVPVTKKVPIEKIKGAQAPLAAAKKVLHKKGRLLIRYSGTEPLLRIMAEGPDQKVLASTLEAIAVEVRKEIGVAP